MTEVSKRVLRLVAKWREIESRHGDVEHAIAVYSCEVESEFVADADVKAFWWDSLGIRLASKIGMYRRMATVVRIVPDAAVWRAVGWDGVREVARIESEKKRAAACARLVADRNKRSSKVGAKAVGKILSEVAPEIFVPRPPVPETAKDREQERMAQAKKAATPPAPTRTPPPATPKGPDRGDVLAKAIQRLVGSGYAFLADLLTPEERKAAGLPAKSSKARAS